MTSFIHGVGLCRLMRTLVLLGIVGMQTLHAQNRPLDRAVETWKKVVGVEEVSDDSSLIDDRREDDQPVADSTPLGIDINAVHLISDQSMASMSPGFGSEVIVIDPEIPAPDGLREIIEPFIGKPASMALLGDLGKEIVGAWRDSDYPLVDVYFPEQNITGGKVQIVVREALLGEKTAEGFVFSREDYLLGQLRVESGDRVNARVVEADIDWLNENPSRGVNLIYERGDEDGTTDIVLDVDEGRRLKGYAGFANTGISQTGENEFSIGASYGNAFQKEQIFGYNFTTDEDWEFLYAHSIFYQAFLPWRHTFGILGAYVESSSRVPGTVGVDGVSQQWSGQYRIPLQRPESLRAMRHYITFAFDYKTTDTDLLFGGSSFFGTEVAIGQFRGGYEFSIPDKLGFTRVSAELVVSPGNMYGGNDDVSFATSRPGSTADYVYGYAEIDRIFNLPNGFRLAFDAKLQATNDRLVSTEQLLAGGYNTVRGFDESIIQGDSGVVGSVELLSPEFDTGGPLNGMLTALAFYDYAAFEISDPIPGETSPSLQSAGLGLKLSLGELGYARASYGWALDAAGVDPAFIDDGKFHFGMTILY